MKINRDTYFDRLRMDPFPDKLEQGQVNGINRLLDVWEESYQPLGWNPLELDYGMATSFHETGAKMQPVLELGDPSYFLKYDLMGNPRKAKELGNTEAGDGFKFRGGGDVQNTGRRNAERSGDRLTEFLGREIDFVNEPETRLDPILSAHSLFLGNHEGWWTGVKLSETLEDGEQDWKNDRTVVNGSDRWREIGLYADAFSAARLAATQDIDAPAFTPAMPPLKTQPAANDSSWSSTVLRLGRSISAEKLPIVLNVNVNINPTRKKQDQS